MSDNTTKLMVRMVNELKKLDAAWSAVFEEIKADKQAKEKKAA